jgi:hypothetical protein
MTRGSYALAFGLAIVSAAFAETGTFSYFSGSPAGGATPDYAVARQQEWIVSEIAGSILNTAAFAGHFESGDPFQVRGAGMDSSGTQRFKLTRRVEEYTVTTAQPWTPDAYVRMARSLMADGAEMSVTEDAVAVRGDAGPAVVSRLLHDHPRSAALHERAAYLLAAYVQKREAARPDFDSRPTLCRITAHLAIARALHPGDATSDGRLAARMLSAAAGRQPSGATPPTSADRPQFWVIEQ